MNVAREMAVNPANTGAWVRLSLVTARSAILAIFVSYPGDGPGHGVDTSGGAATIGVFAFQCPSSG